MAICRVTVSLDWTASSVSGPLTSNNYTFDSGINVPDDDNGAELADIIQTLYGSGLQPIFGSALTGAGAIRMYNLDDSIPREPYYQQELSFATGDDTLPTEAALMVSFAAALPINTSRRRYRGRVHLGPMKQAAIDPAARIQPAVLTLVADAFEDFSGAVDSNNTYDWVCGGKNDQWLPVATVGVSNEPSTVRRRQNARTALETRSV